MSYTFSKLIDARRAVKLARETSHSNGVDDRGWISQGFILKTPTGGIPARSGDVAGKADCVPYLFDEETGTLYEYLDTDDSPHQWTVFNIFQAGDIAGDTFITAKLVYGLLVADAEDCPA